MKKNQANFMFLFLKGLEDSGKVGVGEAYADFCDAHLFVGSEMARIEISFRAPPPEPDALVPPAARAALRVNFVRVVPIQVPSRRIPALAKKMNQKLFVVVIQFEKVVDESAGGLGPGE